MGFLYEMYIEKGMVVRLVLIIFNLEMWCLMFVCIFLLLKRYCLCYGVVCCFGSLFYFCFFMCKIMFCGNIVFV